MKISIPAYFAAIVDCYLQERMLWNDTDDGFQEYVIFADVQQGPLLWNIMYNSILNLSVPEQTLVVSYADGMALIVVVKHLEGDDLYSCEAISAWLESFSNNCEGKDHLTSSPIAVKLCPHSNLESYHHFQRAIK